MAKKKLNTAGGGGWHIRRSDGSGVTVTKMPGGFAEPIDPQQLETAAKAALSMVKTIVESLPIKGEAGLKSDINVIDQWFQSAGEDYTTFERIRNPERLPWPGMGLGTYCVEAPSSKAVAHFHELCRAMARICESYQWQDISDGSEIPNSMQRFGTALIPEVDVAFVRSVAIAAQGLVEDLNPTDTDGRWLIAKLTSQPPKVAVREYSPWIGSPEFIVMMKDNGIRGTGERNITRKKTEWQAESQVGTHSRLFRFVLRSLRDLGITYPAEWDKP